KPARTYVSGETFFARSIARARFGGAEMSPNHRIAACCLFAPSITSGTSVMPNQLRTAATLGTGASVTGAAAGAGAPAPPRPPVGGAAAPAHSLPRPALSGMMPIASARCPPADSPVTTMRLLSMLYVAGSDATKRSAQKQSSTAAGASVDGSVATPRRYSTFTTFQPISIQGSNPIVAVSFAPATQNPPWMYTSVGCGVVTPRR